MALFKSLIVFLVRYETGWLFLKPLASLGSLILRVRNEFEHDRKVLEEQRFHQDLFVNIFETRRVLHGPFKGMQYPSYNSIGSALYPKLMGCYERELHTVIQQIERYDYSQILNIGCGEGYYAIGFARKYPEAKVFACDVDVHALRLCREMAELNHVSRQLTFLPQLSSSDLGKFAFTGRALILCDCEGFEKDLFDSSNVHNLVNCHLLIEIHDFIDIYTSTAVRELFSRTHNLQVIRSLDDIEKARSYDYQETKDMDLLTRKNLFAERRPAIMEWFYLTPITV